MSEIHAPDSKPHLAIAVPSGHFLAIQAALAALLDDPGESVPDNSRRLGLMAGPDPLRPPVIVIRRLSRQIGCKEDGVRSRIAEEGIQGGFDLELAGVGPDGPRQKKI